MPSPDDHDDQDDPAEPDDERFDDESAFDDLPASGPGSLAPVWARGLARIFDMFIVGIAGGLVAEALGLLTEEDGQVVVDLNYTLTVLAVWGVYEVVGTVGSGRTVGKLMMGIRVRSVEGVAPPPPSKAISRWLLPAIGLMMPFVGFLLLPAIYLSAVIRPNLQGFHDRFARTLVVRTR